MLFDLGDDVVAGDLLNTYGSEADIPLTSFLHDSKSLAHVLLNLDERDFSINADITLIDKGTGKTINLLSGPLERFGLLHMDYNCEISRFYQNKALRTWIEGR